MSAVFFVLVAGASTVLPNVPAACGETNGSYNK